MFIFPKTDVTLKTIRFKLYFCIAAEFYLFDYNMFSPLSNIFQFKKILLFTALFSEDCSIMTTKLLERVKVIKRHLPD